MDLYRNLTRLLAFGIAIGSAAWAHAADSEPVEAAPVEAPAAAEAPQQRSQSPQSSVQVADSTGGVLQLDETVISGNQELPKVLYILPP